MMHLLKIQNRFVCFALTLLASCEDWWCTGNCQLDHLQNSKTKPETERATNLIGKDFQVLIKILKVFFLFKLCVGTLTAITLVHLGKKTAKRGFQHICGCDFNLKNYEKWRELPNVALLGKRVWYQCSWSRWRTRSATWFLNAQLCMAKDNLTFGCHQRGHSRHLIQSLIIFSTL